MIFKNPTLILFLLNFVFANPTDGCELNENELFLTSSGDVLYNIPSNIAGIQFTIDNATASSASGGEAATAGFVLQAAGSTVLGFSFSGASISTDCGTLLSLTLVGDPSGLSGLVFSDSNASNIPVTYYENDSDGDGNSIVGAPDWDCDGDGLFENIGSYQNSGSITSAVLVDGINLGSEGDMLGAFVGNELRGLGTPTSVPFGPYTGTYQFLTLVYSNQANGEQASFKFYDIETDTVYNISESFELTSDMTLGNVVAPEILNSTGQTGDYAICTSDNCPSEIYDCAGTCDGLLIEDCAGVCGGNTFLDLCGVCGGFGLNDCGTCDELYVDLGCGCGLPGPSGCDVSCGSTLEFDECGDCGGSGILEGNCDCEGNVDLGCGCGNDQFLCTNGTAVCNINECGTLDCESIPINTIFIDEDGGVWYNISESLGGFQFTVSGAEIISSHGGAAENAGFTVSVAGSTVLGFSFTGVSIPAGAGLLTILEFEGIPSGLESIALSTINATPLSDVNITNLCDYNGCGECDCGYVINSFGDCIPEGFLYNSSTLQAGYFFHVASIDGELLSSDDWVGAFNGDICVGARRWDTSLCGGGVCEVPVMGFEGSAFTQGYMISGQIPSFKIFQSSTREIYNAVVSDNIPWSNLGLNLLDSVSVVSDCNGDLGGIIGNVDGDCACDDVDVCNGFDDCLNTDLDTIPDCLDECPYDAENDADNDGSCGDIDECPYDAENDADNDGICGDIDDCPYDTDNDADNDGICGDIDDCPYDTENDADNDSICGDIDACPYDAENDADNDGVCGNIDLCEGFDDNLDENENSYPDACEGCTDDEAVNFSDIYIYEDGSCYYNYNITYNAGANLESFYVLPDISQYNNSYPTDIFVQENFGNNLTGILADESSVVFIDGMMYGSLLDIDRTSGYWFKMSEDQNVDLTGFRTDTDIVYELNIGNNLISFPSDNAYSVEDALPDYLTGVVTSILAEGNATLYMDNMWVGSLTSLDGFNGYWFESNQNIDFSYDLSEDVFNRQAIPVPKEILIGYEYAQSSMQSFYFIKDIPDAKDGDWIIAFNGDDVVGTRKWNGEIVDVPVMGNDSEFYSFGYVDEGDIPNFMLYSTLTGDLTPLYGDITGFVDGNVSIVDELLTMNLSIPIEVTLNEAYPNPFNPVTNISFTLPTVMHVDVNFLDIQGKLIRNIVSDRFNQGLNELVIDGNNLSSGLYFVQLISEQDIQYIKVLLLK